MDAPCPSARMCVLGSGMARCITSRTCSTRGIALELRDYFGILRRRWLSILLIALTALALVSLLTLMLPKKYTATTQLFFGVGGQSVSELAQGSEFAANQMSSYAGVAT